MKLHESSLLTLKSIINAQLCLRLLFDYYLELKSNVCSKLWVESIDLESIYWEPANHQLESDQAKQPRARLYEANFGVLYKHIAIYLPPEPLKTSSNY